MRPLHRRRIGWIVAATLVGTACSSGRQEPVQPTPQAATPVPQDYTEADIRFMSHMIGHHAQAIVMAGWAPSHGASGSVRTLAERIINAQQDEIVTMQQWLRDRNQPVPDPHSSTMNMSMGSDHEMLMPGMLTDTQMQQLDAARGKEFDRLFLTFMIQHHRGAVSMVKDLFGSYGAAQDELVFKFASDVNVDQTTEIARMEKMLATLPPA
jgi:uncharacterized protein (DUF305 family)